MPKISQRKQLLRSYLLYTVYRALFTPTTTIDECMQECDLDLAVILAIVKTRYIAPRIAIPKAGNLHLAFQYADIDSEHPRFVQMLRVTPTAFRHLLSLIHNHPVFVSQRKAQVPVELQLAVTLYCAGRFGNGASIADVARIAGISEGSVFNFTERCMEAILSLHSHAMRRPTDGQKEREKEWVERESGCVSFREGWCTGDGTLIPLVQKPGLNGDAYFSRKMRYDLSVQIVNLMTNLRIVDYVTGFTGSAHDSSVFQYSAISKSPDWFFGPGNQEFMWADSAYSLTPRVIPVHKRPAADIPINRRFDAAVSHVRIRSEHCMGALKGRWQSLRMLWHKINRKRDHVAACNWIRMCIVLHNLVVDIEGEEWARYYYQQVVPEGRDDRDDAVAQDHVEARTLGDCRRKQLVREYAAYREEMRAQM